ncbi:MAG TPA: hypothetical protein V6D48_17830 [Oculatellaceae cyanobacterium]
MPVRQLCRGEAFARLCTFVITNLNANASPCLCVTFGEGVSEAVATLGASAQIAPRSVQKVGAKPLGN